MKKILLFSMVFIASGACAIAQKKNAKQTVKSQKKMVVPIKKAGPEQEKTTVSKNPKQLDLQGTKLQPATAPAELKDERAN